LRDPSAFGLSFALHVLFAFLAVAVSDRPPTRRITVSMVRGSSATSPRFVPPDDPPHDDRFQLDRDSSALTFPGFEFDVRKVADHAASLFPFLRINRLTFPRVVPRDRGIADGFANLVPGPPPADVQKPPLVLGDSALQLIVDGAWSRRERWTPFQAITRLAESYNPQTGRMPELVRRYVDQNALQPYVDSTARDPRLWTELGIAADHADFVTFVNRYAAQHPSTKATIELLFLLDKLTQGSFDALITLLDTRPTDDLHWTLRANRNAFKLLVLLQQYYQTELDRLDLTTRFALRTHYDNVRLTILNAIISTTPAGYRAADAWYLIGEIHWRAGRPVDAIRSWWKITVDASDTHAVACSDLLGAIRDVAGQDPSTIDPARITRVINRILDADHGRWVSFSFDRLRQFGYRFDRF
jgi:hypothetical protein